MQRAALHGFIFIFFRFAPCFLFFFCFLTCRLVRSSEPSSTATLLEESVQTLSIGEPIYAVVDYEDAYVEPKILTALKKSIPGIKTVADAADLPANVKLVNWSAYEKIPFEELMEKPESMLSCSYIIRCVAFGHTRSQLLTT